MPKRAWLWLLLLTGTIARAEPVEIQYLGNMGVAIRSGSDQVLIDALWDNDYDGRFARVPSPYVKAMRAAESPFDTVDLILATHVHGDHFADSWISSHLRANPDAVFAAHSQSMMLMPLSLERQYRTLDQGPGGRFEEGRLRIGWASTRHAGAAWGEIVNHIYRLKIGGKTIIHMGDADPVADNFDTIEWLSETPDLLIAPQWFFSRPAGRAIIADRIKPKRGLVTHLPTTFQIEAKRFRPGPSSSGEYVDWIELPETFVAASAPGTQIMTLP